MSAGHDQVQGLQKLRQVAAQAQGDDAYRERLVNDPVTVLRQEGLHVPDDVNVIVHENTDSEIHLALPTGLKDAHQLDVNETNMKTLSYAIHV